MTLLSLAKEMETELLKPNKAKKTSQELANARESTVTNHKLKVTKGWVKCKVAKG